MVDEKLFNTQTKAKVADFVARISSYAKQMNSIVTLGIRRWESDINSDSQAVVSAAGVVEASLLAALESYLTSITNEVALAPTLYPYKISFYVQDADFQCVQVDLYDKTDYAPSTDYATMLMSLDPDTPAVWGNGTGKGVTLLAKKQAGSDLVTPNPWYQLNPGDVIKITKFALSEALDDDGTGTNGEGLRANYHRIRSYTGQVVGLVIDNNDEYRLLFDEDLENCDSAKNGMPMPMQGVVATPSMFEATTMYRVQATATALTTLNQVSPQMWYEPGSSIWISISGTWNSGDVQLVKSLAGSASVVATYTSDQTNVEITTDAGGNYRYYFKVSDAGTGISVSATMTSIDPT